MSWFILPIFLIVVLMGNGGEPKPEPRPQASTAESAKARRSEDRFPEPPAARPAARTAARAPAIPPFSPAMLKSPLYTVVVFAQAEPFATSPCADAVAAVARHFSGERIWSFCHMPPSSHARWWAFFEANRGGGVPTVLALRGTRNAYARMPEPADAAQFRAAMQAWLDRLAGGVTLETLEAWPGGDE